MDATLYFHQELCFCCLFYRAVSLSRLDPSAVCTTCVQVAAGGACQPTRATTRRGAVPMSPTTCLWQTHQVRAARAQRQQHVYCLAAVAQAATRTPRAPLLRLLRVMWRGQFDQLLPYDALHRAQPYLVFLRDGVTGGRWECVNDLHLSTVKRLWGASVSLPATRARTRPAAPRPCCLYDQPQVAAAAQVPLRGRSTRRRPGG